MDERGRLEKELLGKLGEMGTNRCLGTPVTYISWRASGTEPRETMLRLGRGELAVSGSWLAEGVTAMAGIMIG